MVDAKDLSGDENLARRVLAIARTFAPCLSNLEAESEAGKDAIAILNAVATDVKARGARAVKSQAIGTARVEYVVDRSAFSDDDRDALAALCAVSSGASAGHPVGHFPKDRPAGHLWPERY